MLQNLSDDESIELSAIQCLWYSDFDYIGLSIELVYKHFDGYKTQNIADLAYSDFGTTKELTQEAERIAKEYAEKFNIELYFPSPDEWSRDCPDWWKAKNAPKCEDCQTPIIPSDSKYLPKEVCYPCHLTRESNARIINAEPYDDGVTLYLYKDGKYYSIGYCTKFESFPIASYINNIVEVERANFSHYINLVELNTSVIADLANRLEEDIEQALLNYETPQIEEGMEAFTTIIEVVFKNRKIALTNRLKKHRKICELIYSYDTAQKALLEGYIYHLYFKKGITSRDDKVLRFVYYTNKNKVTKENILECCKKVLTEQELMETIAKLEENIFLIFKNDEYSVTELGMKLIEPIVTHYS